MRLHILREDTCLAMIAEEYKRNRADQGPLTEPEMEEIWTRWNEELERIVPPQIPRMIDEIQSPKRAAARSYAEIKLTADIEQRWGITFRHLQHLIEAVKELARRFLIRLEETPAEDLPDIHIVRTILAARAIQTALGIEALLRAGHSAPAWAQWRILHELAVVTRFITKHGEKVATAYLQHGVEQSYRTLKAYETHQTSMAEDATLKEMLRTHSEWKKVLEGPDLYGPGFGATYGWAGAAMGKQRPDFADLEKDVGMSVARPQYQLASHVVHPGVRGFLDHQHGELGDSTTPPWEPHASLLGEPLALTAKTLTALTGGLVDSASAASDLVLLGAISHFRDEVLAMVYPGEADNDSRNKQ